MNSYKIFLKTCNFNFQILIQSNKEDISKHIQNINDNLIHEKNFIQEISKKYIQYIKNLNHSKKSSTKNFYIILKYKNENKELLNIEDYASEELRDDREVVKTAVENKGIIIKYASKRLIDDKELAEIAVKQNKQAYHFISNKLKQDDDIKNIMQN